MTAFSEYMASIRPRVNPMNVDYGSMPTAGSGGYWQDPQVVARWNRKLQNSPVGTPPPDWLNAPAVQQAYKYLQYRNAGKPEAEWQPLGTDDPARDFLKALQSPPVDAMTPGERQWYTTPDWTLPTVLSQAQVDAQKPVDYNNLLTHDAFILGLMSPDVKRRLTGANGLAEDIGTGVGGFAQVAMAGLGGYGMGMLAGGAVGAVGGMVAGPAGAGIGGVGLGTIGGILGATVGAGGTAYQLITGQEVPWLQDALNFFQVPAWLVEAGIGTAGEMSAGRAFQDIWANPMVTYEAMKNSVYESQGGPLKSVINYIEPGLAKLYGEQSQVAKEGEIYAFSEGTSTPQTPVTPEGEKGQFGAEATVYWRERLGELLQQGLPMKEASRALFAEVAETYKESATADDFVNGMLLDPLNFVPFGSDVAGGVVARKLGNATLGDLFDTARGAGSQNPLVTLAVDSSGFLQPIIELSTGGRIHGSVGPLQVFDMYKQVLRDNSMRLDYTKVPMEMRNQIDKIYDETGTYPTLQQDGTTLKWTDKVGLEQSWVSPVKFEGTLRVKELTPWQKRFAGLDQDGNPIELKPYGKNDWLRKFIGLTPASQAVQIMQNFEHSMNVLFDMSGKNWDKFEMFLNVASGKTKLDPTKIDPGTEAFLKSATVRSIQGAIATSLDSGVVKNWITAYKENFAEWKAKPKIGPDGKPLLDQNGKPALGYENAPKGTLMRLLATSLGMKERDFLDALTDNKKLLDIRGKIKARDAEFGTNLNLELDNIKEMFTGKDAQPWSDAELQARIFSSLADSMEGYFKDVLGLAPDHWVIRLNNVFKGVQSLALLGFNPMYLLNNAKNNFVTRMAEGIGGYMTAKQITELWDRVGYKPSRLDEGFGATGPTLSDVYSEVINTLMESKDWISKAQRGVKSAGKVAVFANLSRKLEQMESANSYTIGYKKWWDRSWKRGNGFQKMPADLEKALGPERTELVYRAIESGMNKDEIYANVFNENVTPSIRDMMKRTIGKYTDDVDTFMDSFEPVVKIVDDAMKNGADIDTAVRIAETKMSDLIDSMISEEIQRNAENIKNLVDKKGEGVKAFFQVFGDIELENGRKWINMRQDFASLFNRRVERNKSGRPMDGGEFQREFAVLWNRYNGENGVMERSRKLYVTVISGALKAMGIQDGVSQKMITAIMEQNAIWQKFYKTQGELWDSFHASAKKGEKESWDQYIQRTQNEYYELQEQLDNLYKESVKAESDNDINLSDAFAEIYANEFPEGDPIYAQAWRAVLNDYRAEIVDKQIKMRDWAKGENGVQRTPKEINDRYNQFFNGEYNQMIQRFKNMEEVGARWIMQVKNGDMTLEEAKADFKAFFEDPLKSNIKLDVDTSSSKAKPESPEIAMKAGVEMLKKANIGKNPNDLRQVVDQYREWQVKRGQTPMEGDNYTLEEIKDAVAWFSVENKTQLEAKRASEKLAVARQAKRIIDEADEAKREAMIKDMGGIGRNNVQALFQKEFGVTAEELKYGMDLMDRHARLWIKKSLGITNPSKSDLDAWYGSHFSNVSSKELKIHLQRLYQGLGWVDEKLNEIARPSTYVNRVMFPAIDAVSKVNGMDVYDNYPGNFYNTSKGGAMKKRVWSDKPFELTIGVTLDDGSWVKQLPLNIQDEMALMDSRISDVRKAVAVLRGKGYDGIIAKMDKDSDYIQMMPFNTLKQVNADYSKPLLKNMLAQDGEHPSAKVFKNEVHRFAYKVPVEDFKFPLHSGFIMPDGTLLRLDDGWMHRDVVREMGSTTSDGFWNSTGVVRVSGGEYITMPKNMTPEQIATLYKIKKYSDQQSGFYVEIDDVYGTNTRINATDVETFLSNINTVLEAGRGRFLAQEGESLTRSGYPEDLVALHNMTLENLQRALELGDAIPGPSIAVIKSDMAHNHFGEITFVGNRKIVDPTKPEMLAGAGDIWSPVMTFLDTTYGDNNQKLVKVGGQYVEWNPVNVLNALKEDTSLKDLTTLRYVQGMVAKKIKTFDDAHKNAGLLKSLTMEEANAHFDKLEYRWFKIADKFDELGSDEALSLIGRTFEIYNENTGFNPDREMRNAISVAMRDLKDNGLRGEFLDARELHHDMVNLYNDLANTPTEYFEFKPMNEPIGFDEWTGVVVPKNTPKKIVDKLRSYGLDVKFYSKDSDRMSVVSEFYDRPGALFQGERGATGFAKDGKAIVAGLESPDVTTMVHEMMHVFTMDLEFEDIDIMAKHGGLSGAKEYIDLEKKFWAGKATKEEEAKYRKANENLAKGWERYLAEGFDPTVTIEFRRILERFTSFILEAYRKYTGKAPEDAPLRLEDGRVVGFENLSSFAPTGRTVNITAKIDGVSLRDIFDRMLTDEPKSLDKIVEIRARSLKDQAKVDQIRADYVDQILAPWGGDIAKARKAIDDPNGIEPYYIGEGWDRVTVNDVTILDAIKAKSGTPEVRENRTPVAQPREFRTPEQVDADYKSGKAVYLDELQDADLTHDVPLRPMFDEQSATDLADMLIGNRELGKKAITYAKQYIMHLWDESNPLPDEKMVGTRNALRIRDIVDEKGLIIEASKLASKTPIPVNPSALVHPDGLHVVKIHSYNLDDGTPVYAGVYDGNRIVALIPGAKALENVDAPEGFRVLGINPYNPKRYVFIHDATGMIHGVDPDNLGFPSNPALFMQADMPVSNMANWALQIAQKTEIPLHQAVLVSNILTGLLKSRGVDPDEFVSAHLGIMDDPDPQPMAPDQYSAEGADNVVRVDRDLKKEPAILAGLDYTRRAFEESKATMSPEEYATWESQILDGLDTQDYYESVLRGLRTKKGGVNQNRKTIASIDISSDCPMKDTMPCPYCYALGDLVDKLNLIAEGKKPSSSPSDLYRFTNYTEGVLKNLPPTVVGFLNSIGGLRVFSTGDMAMTRYIPVVDWKKGTEISTKDWIDGTYKKVQKEMFDPVSRTKKVVDAWEINMMPYYEAMKRDAGNARDERGNPLRLKFITKVSQEVDAKTDAVTRVGTVEFFSDYKHAWFNLSTDTRYPTESIPFARQQLETAVIKKIQDNFKQELGKTKLTKEEKIAMDTKVQEQLPEVMKNTRSIRRFLDPEKYNDEFIKTELTKDAQFKATMDLAQELVNLDSKALDELRAKAEQAYPGKGYFQNVEKLNPTSARNEIERIYAEEPKALTLINGTDAEKLISDTYNSLNTRVENSTLDQELKLLISNVEPFKRGWYDQEISKAEAYQKSVGMEGRLAVRYVALNPIDAVRAVMDPRIGVVTFYHGPASEGVYKRFGAPEYAGTREGVRTFSISSDDTAWLWSQGITAVDLDSKVRSLDILRHDYSTKSAEKAEKFWRQYTDKMGIDFEKFVENLEKKTCCVTGKCASCSVTCGDTTAMNNWINQANAEYAKNLTIDDMTPNFADIVRAGRNVERIVNGFYTKGITIQDILSQAYTLFEITMTDAEKLRLDEQAVEYLIRKTNIKIKEDEITPEILAREVEKFRENPSKKYRVLGELFAKYVYEGKAPFAEIEPYFKQARSDLKGIYDTLASDAVRNPAMNDGFKEAFDSMFKGVDASDFRKSLAKFDADLKSQMNFKNVVQSDPALFMAPEDTPSGPSLGNADLNSMPDIERMGSGMEELNANLVRPIMDEVRDAYKQEAGKRTPKVGPLPAEVQKGLEGYVRTVGNDLATNKLKSIRYAESARDMAMINYRKQYGFDPYLMMASPYELWYTRTMLNWARRMVDKPQFYAFASRLNTMSQREALLNYPSRLAEKTRIPIPWLPEWAGGGIYTNIWDQLVPFKQFDQPFEQVLGNKQKIENQAYSILKDMEKNGQIPAGQADASAKSEDEIWQKAVAQASQELDVSATPSDLMGMMFQPPLWASYAKNMMAGTPEKNSVLPITRTGQTIRTLGEGTPVESFTNLVGGMLAGPEEYVRKKSGLSEFGEWGDYSIDKALSDMVGNGEITYEQGVNAMLERQGQIFEEAKSRVQYENALKTPGTAPFLAMKAGGNPAGVATILATIFPGGLFPKGELKQRGLAVEYNNAWNKFKNGDDKAIETFFDKYPEYSARLALFKEPEERMRSFLTNQIYDKFYNLPKAQQLSAKNALGGQFDSAMLNPDTKAPDSVDIETLAEWAKILGAMVPKQVDPGVVAQPEYYPDNVAMQIELYNETRKQLFPDYQYLQSAYMQLPPGYQRKAFLQQFPRLKQYWNWNDEWKTSHPQTAQYFEDTKNRAKIEELTNSIAPSLARQLYDYKSRNVPLSSGAVAELMRLYKLYGKDLGLSYGDFLTTLDMLYQ